VLKGLVFHRAIELIHVFPPDGMKIDEVLSQAMVMEDSHYSSEERAPALKGARMALRTVIADPRLERFFGNESQGELGFLSSGYPSLLGRIDRVRVDEEVEILDFKTDSLDGESGLEDLIAMYRDQVTDYCSAFEKIYSEKRVRGYLYFTGAPREVRFVEVYGGI
jgi:ATP-dependent exoDNAse (exonuclease V) beta subunit